MMASNHFFDAFGDLNAALDAASDAVVLLPLRAIAENPNNPRSSFDETELAALALTIKEKGVLQPITVRPADAGGRHVIRFGARRFRAAQIAGVDEIRALVQAGDDTEEELLIEQLIENDQREPLNTADLARAVDRLLALKLSQSDIARRLGRPRDQIALLASLQKMPKELQAVAPQLGIRTLFELNAAWKSDQAGVRRLLVERDVATITQAQARSLAGRAAPVRKIVRNPADGTTQEVETTPPSKPARREPEAKGSAPAPGGRSPHVEVETPQGAGVLVLEPVARATDRVRIRLADGAIIAVSADEVRIVRLRPG